MTCKSTLKKSGFDQTSTFQCLSVTDLEMKTESRKKNRMGTQRLGSCLLMHRSFMLAQWDAFMELRRNHVMCSNYPNAFRRPITALTSRKLFRLQSVPQQRTGQSSFKVYRSNRCAPTSIGIPLSTPGGRDSIVSCGGFADWSLFISAKSCSWKFILAVISHSFHLNSLFRHFLSLFCPLVYTSRKLVFQRVCINSHVDRGHFCQPMTSV